MRHSVSTVLFVFTPRNCINLLTFPILMRWLDSYLFKNYYSMLYQILYSYYSHRWEMCTQLLWTSWVSVCWQMNVLYLVWHGLKEDGRCWDFLLVSHEAVCQVTSVRGVQSHDPAMGLHDGRVDSKVGRWTLQRSINKSVMRVCRVIESKYWSTHQSGSTLKTQDVKPPFDTWVRLHIDAPFLWVQTISL